jgi:hypothetical protein
MMRSACQVLSIQKCKSEAHLSKAQEGLDYGLIQAPEQSTCDGIGDCGGGGAGPGGCDIFDAGCEPCEPNGDIDCGPGGPFPPPPRPPIGGIPRHRILPGDNPFNWPTLAPDPFTALWADVLGLPTGLNCPQIPGSIGGLLCGGVSPILDADPDALNPDAVKILSGVYQRAGAITHPCFWGAWTKDAAESGVGGTVLTKVATGAAADIYGSEKAVTAIGAYEHGKGMLGFFFGEIVKPISNWWNTQVNSLCKAIGD